LRAREPDKPALGVCALEDGAHEGGCDALSVPVWLDAEQAKFQVGFGGMCGYEPRPRSRCGEYAVDPRDRSHPADRVEVLTEGRDARGRDIVDGKPDGCAAAILGDVGLAHLERPSERPLEAPEDASFPSRILLREEVHPRIV